MKKEDFIVGKWYVSSLWSSFIAAKFTNFDNNVFNYSEKIFMKKNHKVCNSFTTNDGNKWNTFREILISEIEHLLPKDHPDLIPEYVKCITIITNTTYKYSGNILNKIYKVKKWNLTSTDCLLENESHGSCNKNRFVSSTKEEYDKQEYPALRLNFVDDFPKEGCYFDDDDILVNYLIKNNYIQNVSRFKKSNIKKYLIWNNFQYWYINLPSVCTKNYTTQQINQLINYNTNQNETNTLQSIETENSRSMHIGTIAIRRGRQQITTGNRPKGNLTSISIGETQIRGTQICKSIVQSANY